MFDLIDGKATN